MKKKVVRKHNNSGNCFVCGINNPWGLKARFYELEDGTVAALVTAQWEHQSYPQRVHGGVITALLDETLGRAINVTEPDTWAVTGDISVRFKKPVPYDEPLLVTGIGVAFALDDTRGLDEKLTETFAAMRADGTMKQIVGKYLPDPEKYLEVDALEP